MSQADLLQYILHFIPAHLLHPRKEPVRPIRIPYTPGYVPPELSKVYPTPVAEKKPFITGSQLRSIVVNLSAERAHKIADTLCRLLPQYGLDDYNIFEEFLPNIAHETGGFRTYSENLNYSAQGLANTWPSRYAAKDTKGNIIKPYRPNVKANALARKPEAIANDTYAGRNGNGPASSGDGWRFRGGGAMMLTGRATFEAYAKYCKMDAAKLADLVRIDDDYAIDSACWYFAIYASLKDLALRDAFEAICRRINGGLMGYQDRLLYLKLMGQYLLTNA